MGWKHGLGCDLRSLVLYRVTLGLSLLWHLWVYRCELDMPPSASSAELWATVFVTLAAVATVLLVLGYRTQPAASAGWFLMAALLSVDAQGPRDTESLILALLFLAAFLPLGARGGIDTALDVGPKHEARAVSLATTALLLSALLSAGDIIASDSERLRYDQWTALAAFLAFVPSAVWDRITRWLDTVERTGLRIFYDRDCGFCHKICLLFRTFLFLGDVPIAPAQVDATTFAIMQEQNSWVIYDHDGVPHVRWHAMLFLLRRSPVFWPIGSPLTAMGMGRWADGLYTLIAANRDRLSKISALLLPYKSVPVRTGVAANIIVGIWLLAAAGGAVLPGQQKELTHSTEVGATVQRALGLGRIWRILE